MDGTENSIYKDSPDAWSAVGRIYKQIDEAKPAGIASGYVEGIGTQDNFAPAKWDSATGYSFDERVETAYLQFCEQASQWLKEDPQAEIRVVGVGFSRGAEQAAALSRMIHERGIMDPKTAEIQRDSNNLVVHAQYTQQLVPPGQTPQALMLFDPVATNVTEHDRRIAPSVLGGLALMSQDRRDLFKGTRLIADGLTEEGRFLSMTLPGVHSDVGNSYPRNGLGVLSANMAVDYLNSLSNQDFLHKQDVPADPAQYAVHRSEEHLLFYTTNGFDDDGQRDFTHQLGADAQCRVDPLPDCSEKAPADPVLDGQIERQPLRVQPVEWPEHLQPYMQPQAAAAPEASFFSRMFEAASHQDHGAMMQLGLDYGQSPAGQAWLQQGRESLQEQQVAEQQLAEQHLQQQQETHHAPVIQMR